MNQPRRLNATTIGLWAVAALLLANLLATWSKNEYPSLLPAAYAQRQSPIAGGAGLFVMPAQLSNNTWGCYLMDVDRGTLCVYEYFHGRGLQFAAARNFTNDTKLGNFNTTPTPQEIADLVLKQNQAIRGGAPTPLINEQPPRDKQ